MNPNKKNLVRISSTVTAFLFIGVMAVPASAIIIDRSYNKISKQNYATKSTVVDASNYITSVNADSNKDSVKYVTNYSPPSSMMSNSDKQDLDSMGSLIMQKNHEYGKATEAFHNSQTNPYAPSYSSNSQASNSYNSYNNYSNSYNGSTNYSSSNGSSHKGTSWQPNFQFDKWLNKSNHRQQTNEYQQYLEQRIGSGNVPPMSQLLLTARSWAACGASPFQVPPRYIWDNMTPTLKLYTELKRQGILPHNTIIRSVYRNPKLNRCANGAAGSKHKVNSAMDLWASSFDYDIWQKHNVQDKLCEFWLYNGEAYNFGLGIYSTGAIHIDTEGYRKWGGKYTARHSPCRY